MIVGENQKFASAIISPDFEALKHFLSEKGIVCNSNSEIIENSEVKALIESEVKRINKIIGKTEEIKRCRMVADVWSTETGELSQTQKLKRKAVTQKYEDLINEIFM